jgi:hypothetical protein
LAWGKRDRGHARDARVAGPPQRVDLVDRTFEVDGLLDVADVDDLLERDVEVGLPAVDDPHVGLGRDEDGLRGLRRPLEDLAYGPKATVARFHGIADLHDPLDYRHKVTPTTMEWRVF